MYDNETVNRSKSVVDHSRYRGLLLLRLFICSNKNFLVKKPKTTSYCLRAHIPFFDSSYLLVYPSTTTRFFVCLFFTFHRRAYLYTVTVSTRLG